MRFIYLSTTNEESFKTKESTINFFKEYLTGEYDFHIPERRIDRNKFDIGEDIFFSRAEKVCGYYTYKIVAYCRSSSRIEETYMKDENLYPYYFKINPATLRIFIDGIDIKYFQNYIDDPTNNVDAVNFTGSIKGNRFTGSQSWVYFDKETSKQIMEWFRGVVFEENIQMLCNI